VTQGGYSTHIVVDQDFALPIPEGIGLAEAAPLLCAGITAYSPLPRWHTGPATKVAVIGRGGPGHLAVKLAHAMGAGVTVLSQSLKKQHDAPRLGADRYYATSDAATFSKLASTFDLIVNTASATINVDSYLSLLALDGVLANVGLPPEPLSVNGRALLSQRRIITGSLIGGLEETRDMLRFCAEHHLGAARWWAFWGATAITVLTVVLTVVLALKA
jgi:alcohol dehydrogenase (NADP+)